MDRTELEDRIRASLQARAGDVTPTPTLWERVAARTIRRARLRWGLWTVSGAAVVVLVVLGAAALLDGPARTVRVDPVQSATPTPTPTPSMSASPMPPALSETTVVTTDGTTVRRVDPATGDVLTTLDVFAQFKEGGQVGDVAVRPGAGPLTVASVLGLEGMSWEIRVSTFGPDGQIVGQFQLTLDANGGPVSPLDAYNADTQAFAPTVVWSPDGRWLGWAQGRGDGVGIFALDWEVAQAEPDQIQAEQIGSLDASQIPDTYLRAQDWVEAPAGSSRMWLTSPHGNGGVFVDVCPPAPGCTPPGQGEVGADGATILDLDHLASGTTLALAVRTVPGDAEGATLALIADPMSDAPQSLPLPDGLFPSATAAPLDAWMDVAGDRVTIGFQGFSAQLLTVTRDAAGDVAVSDAVALPEGTTAASIGVGAGPAPRTQRGAAAFPAKRGS